MAATGAAAGDVEARLLVEAQLGEEAAQVRRGRALFVCAQPLQVRHWSLSDGTRRPPLMGAGTSNLRLLTAALHPALLPCRALPSSVTTRRGTCWMLRRCGAQLQHPTERMLCRRLATWLLRCSHPALSSCGTQVCACYPGPGGGGGWSRASCCCLNVGPCSCGCKRPADCQLITPNRLACVLAAVILLDRCTAAGYQTRMPVLLAAACVALAAQAAGLPVELASLAARLDLEVSSHSDLQGRRAHMAAVRSTLAAPLCWTQGLELKAPASLASFFHR